MTGRNTCKILKDIRCQIAEANGIEFITSECQYKGNCPGTCPKCEAEVRYLEQELERRRMTGKSIAILGVSAGLMAMGGLTACNNSTSGNKETVQPTVSDTVPTIQRTDTIPVQMIDTLTVTKPVKGRRSRKKKVDTLEVAEAVVIKEIKYIPIITPEEEGEVTLPGLIVESLPEFPGGMDQCMQFLQKKLRYPSRDIEMNGRVVIQFTVQRDGSIGDAKVLRSLHPLFDREALRVVNSMPKWKPGNQRGKRVSVKYILPVTFITK